MGKCDSCGEPCPFCENPAADWRQFPDACVCDPEGWDDNEEVNPVCDKFETDSYWEPVCNKCFHEAECHIPLYGIEPSDQEGEDGDDPEQ